MKMLPYCKYSAEEIDQYIRSVKPEQVKSSLLKQKPEFVDFLHFISPAAESLIPEMTAYATAIKQRYFGRTIRMFAPLYISNFCINNCVYCGFRKFR